MSKPKNVRKNTTISQGLINALPTVFAEAQNASKKHTPTTEEVQAKIAAEKNPRLMENDSVILWVTSGAHFEEALIFRGRRGFDYLCIWRRKGGDRRIDPVGLNGALAWLQDAHSLEDRGLVEINSWEPLAVSCFMDLLRYRDLRGMK